MSWEQLGEIASVAQLTGVDAVKLIGMIVSAANTARMHKKNCRQFAQHLKLIGNLLEQLRISEMKQYSEILEPLEGLEDALRRSYILVNSCQEKSYLYLLAMGWNIVYQFRRAQDEVDRYLKIIPLITLVDNIRIRERLEAIDSDQREYTLDEEDRKVQDVILKQESTRDAATSVLKKTLSRSYPNMGFCQALKTEEEKLKHELQRSRARYDTDQCEVIQHLIDHVTQTAASADLDSEKVLTKKKSSKEELTTSSKKKDDLYETDSGIRTTSRSTSYVSSEHELVSGISSRHREDWHTDLLDCCSAPSLCLKTFFFPCCTLAKISTVATNTKISSAKACNELMVYSLILSCCCYTCCIRKKLRKTLNIKGGSIDDFLSHLMCCCCALVQELREVEIRGASSHAGTEKDKEMSPPTPQFMEE
ncbi:PREDICTED: protein MID1-COMPLEMENTING ACTIVITY 2-like isoform X1 [Camelina sativa]|uniref:Protein MID1-COMPLEMENTING ACTIVITY 2-like isoform X1 n=1 Tax=Camelina sativa TaxID=90675 RepID=A0ABM0W9C1_CAMSA|nr:PREDICTED: protein MID1-COMPLEMENTING ACTIVITY 2-like isoform X1 [Camelina sativa]